MASTSVRTIASALALGLMFTACGQKPGVHIDGQDLAGPAPTGPGQAAAPDGDAPLAFDDPANGDAFGGGFDNGFDNGFDTGAEVAPGEGTTPSPQQQQQQTQQQTQQQQRQTQQQQTQQQQQRQTQQQTQQQGQRQPRGSDRTGVSDTTIRLATHAPVTGAAPLPSTSFEKAGDLYWRWITERKGQSVLGRNKVELIFADDRYEPSTARQVCRQLASRAFLVGGGGGTDQIQACGELAGRERFPYFSAGVTEAGLEGNPWYFAVSMTYKQQGELLAQYVKREFGNAKTAAVITQTPNFNDAVSGWEAGVQRHGINYHQTLRHPRGDTAWYSGFANQLGQAGVEVVYILTAPLDYIRFAQVARDQGHDFQFVGVGVSMGLNDVLRSGCPAVGKGTFFSPFPALELADRMDPEFNQAARHFGTPNDDIAWALWGIAKVTHTMFSRYEQIYGQDLTREDFRDFVSNAGRIETGVFPPAEYSPNNHFGGRGVHVLKADCQTRQYRNGGTFRSSF